MWYVIWVATHSEHELLNRIEKDLDKKMYRSVWLPTKTEKRKYKGEWTEVERILFPGYMFIDTEDVEDTYMSLKSFPDFLGVLKNGDAFVPITQKEEGILRKLTGEDGKVGMSVGYLDADGKVKILSGDLKEMEKYIVSVDKHKRKAKLEMELFGEVRTFTVGLELVNG